MWRGLFGCAHKRTTFPLTPKGKPTYIVCLDCACEMPYDWESMRICAQPPEDKHWQHADLPQ